MKKLTMPLLIFLFLSAACNKKVAKSNLVDQQDNDCEWNTTKKYALCVFETVDKKANRPPFRKYAIVDANNNTIKEGTIGNGNALWLNDNAVEIIQTPGNISDDMDQDDLSSIYVITLNKTMLKKEYLQSQNLNNTGEIKVKSNISPDACILSVRISSVNKNIATVEVLDVKVCRTVTKEPKKGEFYKVEFEDGKLLADEMYTLEVSIPAELKDRRVFLLNVLN